MTALSKLLVDSGCLMGRGENSKEGTYFLQWGTSVQKVVRHFTTFCLMERLPWGHFTMFCLQEGHRRKHFIMFFLWHPRVHYAVFFLTWGNQGGDYNTHTHTHTPLSPPLTFGVSQVSCSPLMQDFTACPTQVKSFTAVCIWALLLNEEFSVSVFFCGLQERSGMDDRASGFRFLTKAEHQRRKPQRLKCYLRHLIGRNCISSDKYSAEACVYSTFWSLWTELLLCLSTIDYAVSVCTLTLL